MTNLPNLDFLNFKLKHTKEKLFDGFESDIIHQTYCLPILKLTFIVY